MRDLSGRDLPGFFVNDEVRRRCARLMAHFDDMNDRARPRFPLDMPPEIVQRDVDAPGLEEDPVAEHAADKLMRKPTAYIGPRLEIRVLDAAGRHRYQVVDVSSSTMKRRGKYTTIKHAQRNWPKAILTLEARALALDLETKGYRGKP